MISILLNWIYIGMTSFIIGFACLYWLFEKKQSKEYDVIMCMMAGIVVATVYAQVYSLFQGVSLEASIIYILITIALFFIRKKELKIYFQRRKKQRWYWYIGSILLIIIMAYGTSRGYMQFDSGLYHAQAIRWIEEYGIVPGLGNLHSRFAYNSAAYPLSALFSMSFITGQSLHTVAGFLALLLAIESGTISRVIRNRRVQLLDFVYFGAWYYLFIIYTEMVSPSSDYFAMIGVFYFVIKWVELEEKKEKSIIPYSLLCIFMVFSVSLKLSTAPMLLLVIKPAVYLIKEKEYKKIFTYLSLGLIVISPYLIRNVILSGWLVYPFTFVDFFSFDWEIPKVMADYDSKEIQVYARLVYDLYLYDLPITSWIGNWFMALEGLEKLWVLCSFGCILIGTIGSVVASVMIFMKKAEKNTEIWASFLLLEMTMVISYLFWQTSAPLIRYGYVYVLLLPLITVGIGYQIMNHYWERRKKAKEEKMPSQTAVIAQKRVGFGQINKIFVMGFIAFLSVFFVYKGKNLVESIVSTIHQPYYVMQQDYTTCDTEEYLLGDYTIYIPLESGQIGYDKFPSSPFEMLIELRGTDIKDGFRYTG